MDNKLNVNKEMPSDEEIEKYMDLEGLMESRDRQQKVAFMALVLLSLKRHTKQITIVSVVILFTALSVLAFIKLNKKNNVIKPEAKEKAHTGGPISSHIKEKLHTQTLLLGTNQDMLVKGELGSEFLIPSGAFANAKGQIVSDTVRLSVVEITDKDAIRKNDFTISYKNKNYQPDKVFYLSVSKEDQDLKINESKPLEIIIGDSDVDKQKIFYGIEKQGKFSWALYNYEKGTKLEKVSQSMLEFQRYEDSKRLLDSLKQHYYFEGNNYKPVSGKGMVYTQSFIKEVALFVLKYQEDKSFYTKIKKGNRDWEAYNRSRKILINATGGTQKQETLKIYRSGWFALVRID